MGWVVRAVSDAVERHAGRGEGVMKRGGGGGTGMVEQRKKGMGWVIGCMTRDVEKLIGTV